jgi:ABC-2 type transport system permease protein
MVALGLVLAITLITSILVPHLILEEKRTHTLDVLRVSPLTLTQVLLGKGVAGLIYGLLASAVLLAFNFARVNLWGLMLSAVLANVLFGVGLGLLIGTVAQNEGTLQMWTALLAIILMIPLIATFFAANWLPAWATQLMAWLPTTAAFDLIRLSFGDVWPATLIWTRLAAMLLAVLVVFAAAGWRLRAWES